MRQMNKLLLILSILVMSSCAQKKCPKIDFSDIKQDLEAGNISQIEFEILVEHRKAFQQIKCK